MGNLLLFERLNATPATPHWQIAAATVIAQWLILSVPVALVWSWVQGKDQERRALLEMLLAVLLALGIGQIITHAWPQPRPFMIHLGSQFLPHDPDPGFPSDHVTVFWSLACAALVSARFSTWSAPLFALGLVAGHADCARSLGRAAAIRIGYPTSAENSVQLMRMLVPLPSARPFPTGAVALAARHRSAPGSRPTPTDGHGGLRRLAARP